MKTYTPPETTILGIPAEEVLCQSFGEPGHAGTDIEDGSTLVFN